MKQVHCEMYIDTRFKALLAHSSKLELHSLFFGFLENDEKSRHKTVLILLLLPERCIGQAAHRAEALLQLKVR